MLFAAFRQIDLINSVGTVSFLFLPMPAQQILYRDVSYQIFAKINRKNAL